MAGGRVQLRDASERPVVQLGRERVIPLAVPVVESRHERAIWFAGFGSSAGRHRVAAAGLFEGGVHGRAMGAPDSVCDAFKDIDNEQGVRAVESGIEMRSVCRGRLREWRSLPARVGDRIDEMQWIVLVLVLQPWRGIGLDEAVGNGDIPASQETGVRLPDDATMMATTA